MEWPGVHDLRTMIIENKEAIAESKEDISNLKHKATVFEEYMAGCKSSHDRHDLEHKKHEEYRRQYDDKMKGVYGILTDIRDILKQFQDAQKKFQESEPTIIRVRNNHTAIDTVLKWCGGISVIGVVIGMIYAAIVFFSNYYYVI